MARAEKGGTRQRPPSPGRGASGKKRDAQSPRGRSGGYAGTGAAGVGTTPAEGRSNRRDRRAGAPAEARPPERAKRRGQSAGEAPPEPRRVEEPDSRIDPGLDAALSGFFDSELEEEPEAGEQESEEEPAAAFGTGRAEPREDLDTDGPVIGGPGMIRLGGDRAVSSGTGGLAAGEDLDPVAEGDYWRENFRRSPYSAAETESSYEPAYRFGWKKAGQFEYRNRGFEEVELDLRDEWESSRAGDQSWEEARGAALDAWQRARDRR